MKASIAAAIIAIFGLVLLYYVDIRYFPVNAFWKAAVTGVLTAAIVTYPHSVWRRSRLSTRTLLPKRSTPLTARRQYMRAWLLWAGLAVAWVAVYWIFRN
jgi:hypothetical protein